jgi:hypothetical protein
MVFLTTMLSSYLLSDCLLSIKALPVLRSRLFNFGETMYDCEGTMCGQLDCITCYPDPEQELIESIEDVEIDAVDFNLIPPEDLRYSRDDILEEATRLAGQCVSSLPPEASPAQSRVGVKNMIDVYIKASQILEAMLKNKKGDLH